MSQKVKRRIVLLLLFGGLVFVASCGQNSSSRNDAPAAASVVRIRADLSIKPTLQEIAANYQQETSIRVQVQFVSSADLRTHVPGDSVDVYILANDDYRLPDSAATTADSSAKQVLAYAVPCIVVPQLNPGLISDLKDFTKPGLRIGIADPARDILGAFSLEILKTNKLYDALQQQLVLFGPSALELADAVAHKEVDAAIGWITFPNWTQGGTDVLLLNGAETPRVAVVTALRATMPMDSLNAARLMVYLSSERCQAVFRKWGYLLSLSDVEPYAPMATIGGRPER